MWNIDGYYSTEYGWHLSVEYVMCGFLMVSSMDGHLSVKNGWMCDYTSDRWLSVWYGLP